MSITLVEGAVAAASAASITPAFAQATTAGSCLVARVSSNVAVEATTTAAGWTRVGGGAFTGPPASSETMWYKANCGAGETAPTFTSTGATIMSADLVELLGAHTTAPLFSAAISVGSSPPGAVTTDMVTLAVVAAASTKSVTVTWTDGWLPAGGTVLAAQGTTAKTTQFQWGSSYTGVSGTTVFDSTSANFSGSPGTTATQSAYVAAFQPAPPPVLRGQGPKTPGSILGPGAALQAVHRASRW